MKQLIILFIILGLCSTAVHASEPTCSDANGGYCSYVGKVSRIYVNESNTILLYFDTPMEIEVAAIGGIVTPKRVPAAAYRVTDNPEFARLLYATALTAQATNRAIIIQMRGALGTYPRMDRIWLAE